MEYTVFNVNYEISLRARMRAVIAASSANDASAILDDCIREDLNIVKILRDRKRDMGLRIWEISDSGFKTDKEGALYYH